ncbi:MAG TPA: polysaccharide biosynthesis/export family protein [Vulgatibacter sp.]|nr:polysaccharide biosynthesis/export family protein [Vulgatibacter sp.]
MYRIAARDVISVRVWNQESMGMERARVREDGKISLPFLKDVSVVGMTPNELSEKLQKELVSLIVEPIVTVTLEEPAPLNVSVIGEVATAGAFTMPRPAGVLQAIAAAGGLTPYADRDSIYVLRRLAPAIPPTRIRFRYRDLTSGGTPAAAFLLKSGDVVVVE